LCVRIDGGGAISDAASTSTDASSSELDGGDNMAGTIDAGDAGDAGMCVPSSAVKLLQYTCTNQNDLLCIDQAKPLGVCNATCIAGQIPAGCSGNSCGGGLLFCCANNFMLKSGATCPLVMQGLASTQCAGACAPGTQLCEKDDQCPMGETCRLARVELSMTSSSGSLYVGLCE
jgi:hypothetical protein